MYSQLDKKTLAIVFAVHTAARLNRYASFLSGFDYTLVHRKGKNNSNADFLSRFPNPHEVAEIESTLANEVSDL